LEGKYKSRGRVLESVRTRDVQSDEATAMAEAKRRQGRTMAGTSDGEEHRSDEEIIRE
jgi:hypothetical protein